MMEIIEWGGLVLAFLGALILMDLASNRLARLPRPRRPQKSACEDK